LHYFSNDSEERPRQRGLNYFANTLLFGATILSLAHATIAKGTRPRLLKTAYGLMRAGFGSGRFASTGGLAAGFEAGAGFSARFTLIRPSFESEYLIELPLVSCISCKRSE
jgi:hypothetical protein